jgi:hypothetical protein
VADFFEQRPHKSILGEYVNYANVKEQLNPPGLVGIVFLWRVQAQLKEKTPRCHEIRPAGVHTALLHESSKISFSSCKLLNNDY